LNVDVFPSVDAQALLFNISQALYFTKTGIARLAVAHAIDRDAIVKNVFYDYATKSRMPATASCLDVDERFFDMGVYGAAATIRACEGTGCQSGARQRGDSVDQQRRQRVGIDVCAHSGKH
jgi:hypothetical protein